MDLTPDEQPVVRRAVAAYHEMKKGHKGMFQGTTADEVGVVLSRAREMELTDLRTFWYYREQSLDHLLDLARTRHYSTFDLYGDAEFEIVLDRFARNVEAGYDDLDKVTWRDENTMYVITRTDWPF